MGETSSLSFLHFLKRTIKGYIGSVPFTEEGGQQVTVDTQDSAVEGLAQPLSFDERCSLLDFYFEAVSTPPNKQAQYERRSFVIDQRYPRSFHSI